MSVRAFCQTSALLTLVTLLAGGCERSTPTSLPGDSAFASSSVLTPQELPFQLTGEAVFLGQDLAPDFGPPVFGKSLFGGRCSVPSDLVVRFSIAGQATHMGDVTASEEHCTLLDFQTGRSSSDSDGEMTITAANGDELWVRHHTDPGQQAQAEFVGGTGRFTSASGEAVLHVQCNHATGTCVFQMKGLLAYNASDRSQ